MRRWFAVVAMAVALCAGHSRSAAESRCPPAVVVTGDSTAATTLREQLMSRGVRTTTSAQCPALQAHVLSDADGVAVELVDREGQTHRRSVSTTEIAAIWIESWTRNDIASTLMPLTWHASPALVTTRVAHAATTATAKPASLTDNGVVPPISVGLLAQTITANDDSAWTALNLHGCAHIGGVCIGVMAGYSRNRGFTRGEAMVETDREAWDLTATIGVPLAVGRGTLTPQFALGGRRLTSSGSVELLEPPPPCGPTEPDPNNPDPADPGNPDGTNPGDPTCVDPATHETVTKTSILVRAQVSLMYAVPITNSAAITLGLGASWTPGAHTKDFRNGTMIGPDGTVIEDPTLPPDPISTMPGEPLWTWSAGIGLKVVLR